jgi:hypothetical protein
MKRPWTSMPDDQLVELCRLRPVEAAWERFGKRFGCHLVAAGFVAWVAWVAFTSGPMPWYGALVLFLFLIPSYFFAAVIALLLVFILPACVRASLYADELDRRQRGSFPRELRRARRLSEGADPPDWIILVHSQPMAWRWISTRLTLFESPPRGLREHRSGASFGIRRDPTENPLNALVREDRPLDEDECLSALAALREIDLDRVADVYVRADGASYDDLAVLRRDPLLMRKATFCTMGVLIDPDYRRHPTYRLASLVIKLPEDPTE